MNNKKLGFSSASAIIATVFSLMGGLFSVLGVGLACFPVDEEDFIVGIVFAALGVFFLLFGLGFVIAYLIHKSKVKKAIAGDSYIWGEIADIIPVYYSESTARCRYCVLARHTDSRGQIHIFRSSILRNYPDRSIIGHPVRIYTDKERFKHYYVELDGILPNVIEH